MNATIQVPDKTSRVIIHTGGYPTICFYKMTVEQICQEVISKNDHIKSVQVTFLWYNLQGWPIRECHYLNVREKFLYD